MGEVSHNQFRVERRMLENQESYQRMTIEREWKMLWDLIDDQAAHVLELIRSEERRRAAWLIVSNERERMQRSQNYLFYLVAFYATRFLL